MLRRPLDRIATWDLAPGEELMEFVCENNRLEHIVDRRSFDHHTAWLCVPDYRLTRAAPDGRAHRERPLVSAGRWADDECEGEVSEKHHCDSGHNGVDRSGARRSGPVAQCADAGHTPFA